MASRLIVEALRQVWRRTLHARPADSSERDTERAYIYHHLTSINYFLNRPAHMILATNCAVNAGERSTDKLRLTEAYMGFANVTGILGLHGVAQNYSRLAWPACRPGCRRRNASCPTSCARSTSARSASSPRPRRC